jgi:uncharacterized protein YbcI
VSGDQARPTRADTPERSDLGRQAGEVSGAIVRLFSRYAGRGPTKARTTLNANLVAVVLENALTTAELTLVAAGEVEPVKAMRRKYHDAMREKMIEAVERIVDRKVVTLLSDIDPVANVAAEVFVLEHHPDRGLTATVEMGEEQLKAET